MRKLLEEQIEKDCSEILSIEAGKRFLGCIFYQAGLNEPAQRDDYHQGVRDAGLMIANTVRAVNPYGVAECEIAYADLRKRSEEDGRDDTDYDIDE